MTPKERIAELRKVVEAAFDSPWKLTKWTDDSGHHVVEAEVSAGCVSLSLSDVETQEDAWPEYLASAAFIAQSRTMVPALLDALEKAIEALDYVIEHELYHGVNQGRASEDTARATLSQIEKTLGGME